MQPDRSMPLSEQQNTPHRKDKMAGGGGGGSATKSGGRQLTLKSFFTKSPGATQGDASPTPKRVSSGLSLAPDMLEYNSSQATQDDGGPPTPSKKRFPSDRQVPASPLVSSRAPETPLPQQMPQTPQNVTSLDQNEDEDDDEVIGFRKRLRKRTSVLLPDSEDEDIENSRQLVPGPSTRRQSAKKAKIQEPEDEGGSSWPSIDDEMDLDDFVIPDEEPPSTPKKPKPVKPRTPSSRLVTPQKPPPSASKLQAFSMTPNSAKKATTPRTPFGDDKKKTRNETFKQKNEERYAWLLDPKDEDGRSPTEEGYDPRTLLIPKNAWNRFTPFEKQFWEIKSQHWDTVIFFKKGKFYELYEKDADIGHQHFDLKLTDRVNMRMVGVPESSFDHWAAQFLAKGYRVGKVDQMENAVGKAMRDREKTSKSQDDKIIRRELKRVLTVGTLVDAGLLTDDMGTYTMAIVEELEADHLPPKYGVAFVDTATSEFSLCCFDDDVERTRLETLIMQVKPAEVILKKGSSSKALLRLLKNNLRDLQTTQLAPEREFWTAEMLIDELRMGRFIEAERESWPAALQEAQAITLEAMGGLVYYLRYLKIEQDLLSAKNFHTYDPIRQVGSLILDGQTLINLEIFENTSDGTDKGTLHKLLNHCETPFGKRLFKKWLCHPLRNKAEINDRLNALEDFTNIAGQREKVQSTLRKLPDLERIISRIHAGAVRVKEFCDTLSSFEAIGELLEEMNPFIEEFTSLRLKRIFTAGLPTELQESLQYFREAFDRPTALSNDTIELHSGYDAEFDKALQEVERLEQALETHRLECQKSLKCKVTFKDMGKELFQMEVPKSTKVPRNWQIKSNTASVSRYWNDRVEDYVKEYREAQERKDEALRNIKSFLCKKFDEHYVQWLAVVKSVAELDCMISLAKCKEAIGEPSCRPEFVDSGESLLEIDEMRHPCINHGITQEFIPNDLHFGGDAKPNMVLLTGPNMGGKSTLLRQTCISVIMAQLGCYVPARSCRMTIFDRIFTRLGANDNILAGQSTFMVELAETCKIMREATPRSFVILDELGRGTSTFDGYAIAYAVLHHLITHVRCLGLFSTHYRMLTNEFDHNALVTMKYMSFLTDEEKGEVTFLYKLAEGSCPKSYGMNVAKIAGILDEIVEKADRIAAAFQHRKESFSDSNAQLSNYSLTRLANFAELMAASKEPTGDKKAQDLVRTIRRSLTVV